MIIMKRALILCLALLTMQLLSPTKGAAQELNMKVTVNHNQIQGTDASVFDNLQHAVSQK